jgi:uncharacterized protein
MIEMISVEVAYALPQSQTIISLSVPNGTTAIEAIQQSGLLINYPEISVADCKIGIFGKAVRHDAVLQPQDRVELYRPLIANAKEARRLRAATKDNVAKRNKSGTAAKTGQQKRKT